MNQRAVFLALHILPLFHPSASSGTAGFGPEATARHAERACNESTTMCLGEPQCHGCYHDLLSDPVSDLGSAMLWSLRFQLTIAPIPCPNCAPSELCAAILPRIDHRVGNARMPRQHHQRNHR